ncbi:ZNF99 protein, partial [Amia calva]|nr:ZNF99 protein [Amia calva]
MDVSEFAPSVERTVKSAIGAILKEIAVVFSSKLADFQTVVSEQQRDIDTLRLKLRMSEQAVARMRDSVRAPQQHRGCTAVGESAVGEAHRHGVGFERVEQVEECCPTLPDPTHNVPSSNSAFSAIQKEKRTDNAKESNRADDTEQVIRGDVTDTSHTQKRARTEDIENEQLCAESKGRGECASVKEETPDLECVGPTEKIFQLEQNAEKVSEPQTAPDNKDTADLESASTKEMMPEMESSQMEEKSALPKPAVDYILLLRPVGSIQIPSSVRPPLSHGDAKPETVERFRCTECGKELSNLENLKRHLAVHPAMHPKPHVCNTCGKGFQWLSYLQRHERTHTEEKSYCYHCSECGKSFRHLSTLKRHRMTLRGHSTSDGPKLANLSLQILKK